MATAQRQDAIARAKIKVGAQAQNINLDKVYDGITAFMSTKFPFISNCRATSTGVIGQNYLAHSSFTPLNASYPIANITPLTRLELINEALKRANLKAEGLLLTSEYDMVLKDITGRYDILPANYATGNFTAHASNNYLTAPTDMKHVNHMKADTSTRVEVVAWDPDLFLTYYPFTFGASSIPIKHWYNPLEARIYGNPWPSSGTIAYYLWYTKFHPVASGGDPGAYQHILGDEFDETITLGLAAYACEATGNGKKAKYWRMMFEEDLAIKAAFMNNRSKKFLFNAIELEWMPPGLFFTHYSASNSVPKKWTWTWIDGAAANAKFWIYPSPDAASAALAVYSIGNPKSTGITYQHLMGEELDEAVFRGLCWKAYEIIGNFEWALYWKALFDFELSSKADEKLKRVATVHNTGMAQA